MAAGAVAGVALSIGLAAAGPASATGIVGASISSITTLDGTPVAANGLLVQDDESFHYDTWKVVGTSTSSAAGTHPTLDLRCYSDDTSATAFVSLKSGITPNASGAWTAYVDPYNVYGHRCKVRAVPTSYASTSFLAYPAYGTTLSRVFSTIDYWGFDNPSGHAPYYYALSGFQGSTYVHGFSASDDGLTQTSLSANAADLSAYGTSVWNGAASFLYLNSAAGPISARSSITVDGHPAYDGEQANTVSHDAPGQPPAAISLTMDPDSGVLVATETSNLVTCLNSNGQVIDTLAPTPAQCPSFGPSGVRFTRVSTTNATGDVTTIRDSFTAADGGAHTVDWMYVDRMSFSDAKLPGQSDFAAVTAGQSFPVTTWPQSGSELFRTDTGTPTGSATSPIGAIAYSAKPNAVVVYAAGRIYQQYTRAVPGGRTATLTRTFVTAPSVTAASAGATTALAGNGAVLTPNPLPATVGTRAITVSGKIAPGSNGLPDTVTANGVSGPVAADGTFSIPVELTPGVGPKVIAIAGADFTGTPVSGQVVTDYANPVTSGAPQLAKTRSAGKVTKATLTVPVSCASFGPVAGCRAVVKLGARGKLLAPTRNVLVGRGKTVAVKLTLSVGARAQLNRLAAGKHLFGNLQTIYADAGGGLLALKVRSVKLA